MPSVPDLTGRFVGEYEIRSLLGVGGMGAVYEGRHPVIGKRVAVKVLLPALSEARPLVERFIDEARAVNEIGHRGIVDIFAFGKLPEGSVYFVMEYLDGQPLDRVIKKGPIALADALAYTEEMCDALAAAHHAGIIHRDIKPSNIYLVTNQRGQSYLKLLDFGIAKLGANSDEASPQTMEGLALGTPDYMSPEQARGMPISPAADLYSVGCVLFELLTGRRVFKGPNPQRTMFMHAEDPPPAPSSLRPEVPEALDNLVLWMLEKYPDARPKSAMEVKAHCATLRQQLPGAIPAGATAAPVTPIPPRRSPSPTPLPSTATPGPKPANPPTQPLRPPRPPAEALAMPPELPGPPIPPEVPGPPVPPEIPGPASPQSTSESRGQLDPVQRAARAEADFAELEAGKVVIISRPLDPEVQDAPTKVVPVLEPVLVALRAKQPPPASPWEGTQKMAPGEAAGVPHGDLAEGSLFAAPLTDPGLRPPPAVPAASAPRPSAPPRPSSPGSPRTPQPPGAASPRTPAPAAAGAPRTPAPAAAGAPRTPAPPSTGAPRTPAPAAHPAHAEVASVGVEQTAHGQEGPTGIDSRARLARRRQTLAAVGVGVAASALILWFGLRGGPPDKPPDPTPIHTPVEVHDDPVKPVQPVEPHPEDPGTHPEAHVDTQPEVPVTAHPDAHKPPPPPRGDKKLRHPKAEANADEPKGDRPPKPDKGGVTAAQLTDRIARCEALLAKREAAQGADPVLRGFVAQVRAEASNADTDAKRRDVMAQVNDLLQQLSE